MRKSTLSQNATGLGGFPHEQLHQEGSNNRNKSRVKVARVNLLVANCRTDFDHKLSRRIVNENKVICVESLAVANMVKNHKLAKAIREVGWGQFCTMLKYKAEQFGKVYQEIDRFFPSSKTCNVCLNQVDSLPLEIRFWDCDNCATKHIDRDINAAKKCDSFRRNLEIGRIPNFC